MSDEPPSAPSAPAEHPSVESNTPAETTAAQNDTSSSASGYATPLNQDDPQSKSPEQDKPLSDHPASLKLRASLKKRKSQEAERLKQQQPDPLDVFGQVSLPSTGIATFPGPCYESAAMAKLVLTENQWVLHYLLHALQLMGHVKVSNTTSSSILTVSTIILPMLSSLHTAWALLPNSFRPSTSFKPRCNDPCPLCTLKSLNTISKIT